ncbi:MAG: hypothetical protein ACI9C1_003739 [Candidatus Aldehydirespiratoraceae bacterium]|jgi:hypothetical protein
MIWLTMPWPSWAAGYKRHSSTRHGKRNKP